MQTEMVIMMINPSSHVSWWGSLEVVVGGEIAVVELLELLPVVDDVGVLAVLVVLEFLIVQRKRSHATGYHGKYMWLMQALRQAGYFFNFALEGSSRIKGGEGPPKTPPLRVGPAPSGGRATLKGVFCIFFFY